MNKIKVKSIFILVLIIFNQPIFGQSAKKDSTNNKVENTQNKTLDQKNNKWGAGIQLSTNGIGFQFARSIHATNKFILKIGGTYLPINIKNYASDFSGTKLSTNLSINLGAIGAYVDWHPFGNSFKITGGLAYLLTNLNGTSIIKDSVVQGELKLDPNKVGNIKTEIKTNPIAPYLAFGFGRSIPKHRLGFGVELGTYYIGAPKVSFVCSGILEPSSSNEAKLNENLKVNQFLHQLVFNVNFKF